MQSRQQQSVLKNGLKDFYSDGLGPSSLTDAPESLGGTRPKRLVTDASQLPGGKPRYTTLYNVGARQPRRSGAAYMQVEFQGHRSGASQLDDSHVFSHSRDSKTGQIHIDEQSYIDSIRGNPMALLTPATRQKLRGPTPQLPGHVDTINDIKLKADKVIAAKLNSAVAEQRSKAYNGGFALKPMPDQGPENPFRAGSKFIPKPFMDPMVRQEHKFNGAIMNTENLSRFTGPQSDYNTKQSEFLRKCRVPELLDRDNDVALGVAARIPVRQSIYPVENAFSRQPASFQRNPADPHYHVLATPRVGSMGTTSDPTGSAQKVANTYPSSFRTQIQIATKNMALTLPGLQRDQHVVVPSTLNGYQGNIKQTAFTNSVRADSIRHQRNPEISEYTINQANTITKWNPVVTPTGYEGNVNQSAFTNSVRADSIRHQRNPEVSEYTINQANAITKWNPLVTPSGYEGNVKQTGFTNTVRGGSIRHQRNPDVAEYTVTKANAVAQWNPSNIRGGYQGNVDQATFTNTIRAESAHIQRNPKSAEYTVNQANAITKWNPATANEITPSGHVFSQRKTLLQPKASRDMDGVVPPRASSFVPSIQQDNASANVIGKNMVGLQYLNASLGVRAAYPTTKQDDPTFVYRNVDVGEMFRGSLPTKQPGLQKDPISLTYSTNLGQKPNEPTKQVVAATRMARNMQDNGQHLLEKDRIEIGENIAMRNFGARSTTYQPQHVDIADNNIINQVGPDVKEDRFKKKTVDTVFVNPSIGQQNSLVNYGGTLEKRKFDQTASATTTLVRPVKHAKYFFN